MNKAWIIPTGSLALNTLGLSTQIPMNAVYLHDGAARKINLGKRKIIFKKMSPKNLSAIGKISSLVIQAAREIGKDHILRKQKTNNNRSPEKRRSIPIGTRHKIGSRMDQNYHASGIKKRYQ